MTATVASGYVELVPLTLVDEGDVVVVGDPRTGQFISVPAVGAVVIRALQRGASIEEAGAEASAYAGEHVDVAGFVDGLRELGYVAGTGTGAGPEKTAPVQQRRWVGAIAPGLVRPLFSRVAWCGYTGAALFVIGVFIGVPALRPRPHDVFVLPDYGLSVLLLVPLSSALICLHECWHWLAARALGLSVRFGIDRRWYYLVFETDLSQLWTVPRRQRYGPQLAGIAIDSTVAALLVGARWLLSSAGHTGPRSRGDVRAPGGRRRSPTAGCWRPVRPDRRTGRTRSRPATRARRHRRGTPR